MASSLTARRIRLTDTVRCPLADAVRRRAADDDPVIAGASEAFPGRFVRPAPSGKRHQSGEESTAESRTPGSSQTTGRASSLPERELDSGAWLGAASEVI